MQALALTHRRIHTAQAHTLAARTEVDAVPLQWAMVLPVSCIIEPPVMNTPPAVSCGAKQHIAQSAHRNQHTAHSRQAHQQRPRMQALALTHRRITPPKHTH